MIRSGVVPEVTTIKSAGGWSSREAVCNVGEGSERLDPTCISWSPQTHPGPPTSVSDHQKFTAARRNSWHPLPQRCLQGRLDGSQRSRRSGVLLSLEGETAHEGQCVPAATMFFPSETLRASSWLLLHVHLPNLSQTSPATNPDEESDRKGNLGSVAPAELNSRST